MSNGLVTANQFQLVPNMSGAIGRGIDLHQKLQQPQINQLSRSAAGGDQSSLSRLAGLDPERATQIQKFNSGQSQNSKAEEESRIESVMLGALQASILPDDESKLSFLKNRRSELASKNIKTGDTDEIIALYESGNSKQANALIDGAVQMGVRLGKIKPSQKLSPLQQKVQAEGIEPNSKEGFARAKELNQRAATDTSLKPTDQQIIKSANEGQLAAAGFANRVNAANANLDEIESIEGFDPTSIQAAFFGAVPGGNIVLSDDQQRYSQAKRDFITAVLRKESGAAIGKDEFINEDKKFFPQVGDKPGVLKQKAAGRKRAFENLKNQSKGVFKVQFDNPQVFTGDISDMSDEDIKKALGL